MALPQATVLREEKEQKDILAEKEDDFKFVQEMVFEYDLQDRIVIP